MCFRCKTDQELLVVVVTLSNVTRC
jgi:hypothetical protein